MENKLEGKETCRRKGKKQKKRKNRKKKGRNRRGEELGGNERGAREEDKISRNGKLGKRVK